MHKNCTDLMKALIYAEVQQLAKIREVRSLNGNEIEKLSKLIKSSVDISNVTHPVSVVSAVARNASMEELVAAVRMPENVGPIGSAQRIMEARCDILEASQDTDGDLSEDQEQ